MNAPARPNAPTVINMDIATVDVSDRSRRDLGDIDMLAASIEEIGLLHPIVVSPENKLIVGLRRLEAHKMLGRSTIQALVADTFDELDAALTAERDENTCRKSFTLEEAVHVGRRYEGLERPKAEMAAKEGRSRGGKTAGNGRPKDSSRASTPQAKRSARDSEAARTNAKIAESVGMKRRTYEKAEAVVDSGDDTLIAEMNRTGKVNGIHRKLVNRQLAEKIKK